MEPWILGKHSKLGFQIFKKDPSGFPSFKKYHCHTWSLELVEEQSSLPLFVFEHSANFCFNTIDRRKNIFDWSDAWEVPSAKSPAWEETGFFKDLPIEIEKIPQIDLNYQYSQLMQLIDPFGLWLDPQKA